MKNLELFVLILFMENQKRFNILKLVKRKENRTVYFPDASKKVPDIILILCCCIEKNSSLLLMWYGSVNDLKEKKNGK